MPCQDGGPCEPTVSQSSYDAIKKRLDLTTRLLCSTLTWIDKTFHINIYDSDTTHKISEDTTIGELRSWWDKHKIQDQERLAKEKEKNERFKAKLKAEIKKMQEELKKLR